MWPLLHTIHPLLLMCMYVCFTSAGHEAFCSRVQVFRTPKRKQLGYSQINAINKVRRKSKNTQLQRREELCWVRGIEVIEGEKSGTEKRGMGLSCRGWTTFLLNCRNFSGNFMWDPLYFGPFIFWSFKCLHTCTLFQHLFQHHSHTFSDDSVASCFVQELSTQWLFNLLRLSFL